MDEGLSHLITGATSAASATGIYKLVQVMARWRKSSGQLTLARDKQIADNKLASDKQIADNDHVLIDTLNRRIEMLEFALADVNAKHLEAVKAAHLEHLECMKGQGDMRELIGEMKGSIRELRDRLSHNDLLSGVALKKAEKAETTANIATNASQTALVHTTPPDGIVPLDTSKYEELEHGLEE